MRFELDEALIDDILFHMENQNGSFMLDTQKGVVVNIEDCDDRVTDGVFDDEDRFVSLPNWTAQDGYRLMEKFTVELKNPLVRQELSAALNISKGVFRAFKNTLAQYPETEKLWNRRKRQKMKDEVAAWYNSQRETWGLEPVGSEPEDTLSLLLEDFVLRQGNSGDIEKAAALHKLCIEQIEDKTAAAVFEKMNPLIFPVDFLFAAETASGKMPLICV